MSIEERLNRQMGNAEVEACCKDYSDNVVAMEEIYKLLWCENKRVAGNAAWVLTRMPEERVGFMQRHQEEIIDLAMSEKESITVRRLSLNILNRQTFDIDELRADFLDYCLETMMNVKETPGLRALSMKLAYKQCVLIPELLGEFMQYADLIKQQPMPPAIRSTIKNILKETKNKKR